MKKITIIKKLVAALAILFFVHTITADPKKWQCLVCNDQLSTREFLRKHYRENHNDQITCPYCLKTYKSSITEHIKSNHKSISSQTNNRKPIPSQKIIIKIPGKRPHNQLKATIEELQEQKSTQLLQTFSTPESSDPHSEYFLAWDYESTTNFELFSVTEVCELLDEHDAHKKEQEQL